jgi:uncharacterized coiled-coil protein SlyX
MTAEERIAELEKAVAELQASLRVVETTLAQQQASVEVLKSGHSLLSKQIVDADMARGMQNAPGALHWR